MYVAKKGKVARETSPLSTELLNKPIHHISQKERVADGYEAEEARGLQRSNL
jgi:hypothetical protein